MSVFLSILYLKTLQVEKEILFFPHLLASSDYLSSITKEPNMYGPTVSNDGTCIHLVVKCNLTML